jgi:flagella basal body P-ring formation protein FlgA
MCHALDSRFPIALLLALLLSCIATAAPPATPVGGGYQEIEQLQERIRGWMSGELGLPEQRISFAPVDQRLRPGRCEETPAFDFPFANRDLVRVRCRIPEWQLFIRTLVQEEHPQVIAARALESGTVIKDADLGVRMVESQVAGAFADRSRLVGRILRRAVPAGMILQAVDLDRAIPVVRIRTHVGAGQVVDASALVREFVPASAIGGGMVAPGLPGPDSIALRDLEPGRILMADDWSVGQRALVARQAIPAGRVLEASLFESALVPGGVTAQSALNDWSALEHAELSRPLRPGEPLVASAIRPALLVQRGSTVVLTRGRPGAWELSLRTEALEDGRFGERIRLRNPESGKTISARVIARGIAQIAD